MSASITQFQNKTLRKAATPEEYDLYRAALEWDLIDPIVIEDRKDLKSEHRWRDRVEPYDHQVTNLITFCRRLPVTLLADDVGLGKTISAGLIASELISRGRLSKILIVCPKILREQWKEELETKFNIPCIIVTGKELISAKIPPGEAGAIITTYHTARLYLDKIKKANYEMLVLDEAHKLRNLYGVDPPPQVAVRFREALAARQFKYVLMLTATPIQNRLWDLYSLVDLLTVARGHENPFGTEGMFVRKFVADSRTQARQLIPEMREEFRSIVYGYMSRVRRGEANLHFPERVVQLHTVNPTSVEIELIETIAEPIQKLNYLAQIIILQALISSPEALVRLLDGMADRGTVPKSLAVAVKEVAKKITVTAKLNGLGLLVDRLKSEKPESWRAVVFTRWRETQTTIQNFLEKRGVSCGLINGDSSSRNQETIAQFKKDIPGIHVIISTEAGSEGINLQAANVLVNYDLPWNPMIVEQRIGRIQRLSSNYAKVSIFNIVLKGTFEEYIVGRLMEKLQMASHAIGDIESLLEASGIDEDEENGSSSFEEKIRQLVIASLAGKNVEKSTLQTERSIQDARIKLENEEKNINSLLGKMDGALDEGPRCPKLPAQNRSMDSESFVMCGLKSLGAELIPEEFGQYVSKIGEKKELIRFEENHNGGGELSSTLYRPGSSAFELLVSKLANHDLHRVEDIDTNPLNQAEILLHNWAGNFATRFKNYSVGETWRCFEGFALIRIRATVACDSYERLIQIPCSSEEHKVIVGRASLDPINNFIENPQSVGVIIKHLKEKALQDQGISEFSRFYMERRALEMKAAGETERKRKKIEDDFTPRVDIQLVGLEGKVSRQLKCTVSYLFDTGNEYTSSLILTPSKGVINSAPIMAQCEFTKKVVPQECLAKCEISDKQVLSHLLVKSEISERKALPEYIVICGLTGKKVLTDEVEESIITRKPVIKSLLKTSALSGKRAESEFFSTCAFTNVDLLESELGISQVSGKRYRIDEQLRSVVSGKTGHKQEFIFCSETNQPLLTSEAEQCEITNEMVIPGLLEKCEVTGKKVLPKQLEKSAVSGKKALKQFFVSSSLSTARLLEEEAIKSVVGKFCAPLESKICLWSGVKCHPDDLRVCKLTGLLIHFEYLNNQLRLNPLINLLDGIQRKAEKPELWIMVTSNMLNVLGTSRFKVEAAELSPDEMSLAISLEIRSWGGLKVRHAGCLYSIKDGAAFGRVVIGKRESKGWIQNLDK